MTKKLLHVGCGPHNKRQMPAGFHSDDWQEIRLDIDPDVKPDIIGTMLDMANVESESIDALYSAHNIEHVFAHEVPVVLAEFRRVLKPGGFVVATCPDLQTVCEAVVNDQLTTPLYQSNSGPVTPLEILYGLNVALVEGKLYMAHKCGFTWKTLCAAFDEAGFGSNVGGRRPQMFDLWILAFKTGVEIPEEVRMQHAALYLP